MYFYVVEALTTQQEKRRIDDIRSILSQLGIAGEMAVASPARSVEEHLELAFKKGFTTLVAIGDDGLFNRVASMILAKKYDKAALGVIPLASGQKVGAMVGSHSVRDFCQTLRTRILMPIDAVELDKNHAFITQASIQLKHPVDYKIVRKDHEFTGKCTDLYIGTDGLVTLRDKSLHAQSQNDSLFTRFFGAKSADDTSLTQFVDNHWAMVTAEPCELVVDGHVMTKTPLEVLRRPKALKLIVNRARITTENGTDL